MNCFLPLFAHAGTTARVPHVRIFGRGKVHLNQPARAVALFFPEEAGSSEDAEKVPNHPEQHPQRLKPQWK